MEIILEGEAVVAQVILEPQVQPLGQAMAETLLFKVRHKEIH